MLVEKRWSKLIIVHHIANNRIDSIECSHMKGNMVLMQRRRVSICGSCNYWHCEHIGLIVSQRVDVMVGLVASCSVHTGSAIA